MASRQRPGAGDEALNRLGADLAASLSVSVTEVRYATYRFHNGTCWTMRACWEWRTEEGWQEVSQHAVPDSYRAGSAGG